MLSWMLLRSASERFPSFRQKGFALARNASNHHHDTFVDPAILKRIESIGVGRVRRKGRRQQGLPGDRHHPTTHRKTPTPFGSQARPVKIVSSVSAKNDPESWKFPPFQRPEIALIGRSNAGKSTLLNALLYADLTSAASATEEKLGGRRRGPDRGIKLRKGVKASTSNMPGETKEVTFYQLADRDSPSTQLCLVDLPGYGFAFASEPLGDAVKQLILAYIASRMGSLNRLLLLIDSRHGLKRADIEFLQQLEGDMVFHHRASKTSQRPPALPPIQIILTKCDLVPPRDLARRVQSVKHQLADCLRRETSRLPVMMTSAKPAGPAIGGGLVELQRELANLIPGARQKKQV